MKRLMLAIALVCVSTMGDESKTASSPQVATKKPSPSDVAATFTMTENVVRLLNDGSLKYSQWWPDKDMIIKECLVGSLRLQKQIEDMKGKTK